MSDDLDTLERLADLRDRGILTAEEFDAKKRQLLSGTGSGQRTADKAPASAATAPTTPSGIGKKNGSSPRGFAAFAAIVGAVILLLVIVSNNNSKVVNTGPSPTPTPAPDKQGAVVIDPRQLVADPQSFRGRNIVVEGQALNVDHSGNNTWVQFLAQVPGRTAASRESIVVEFRPRETSLLKGECYRVFGVVAGTQQVTRTLTGAKNTVPLVDGYAYESNLWGRPRPLGTSYVKGEFSMDCG